VGCSTASMRWQPSPPTGGQLILVGGGARSRAYRQVLADLSGREVVVPHSGEQVAAGAYLQTAAAASGTEPAYVADAWNLAAGDVVEPGQGVTAAADVRAAYIALRDATAG
jgi:xylulokinase